MASLFGTILRRVPQLAPAVGRNVYRNFAIAPQLHKPRVQEPAPSFKGTAVVGESFKEIHIEDYKGQYLVLVFYPLDFTFVCPTELVALDEKYHKFKELGAEVIGISVDSHYTHLGWMNTNRSEGGLGKLKFPLLSDIKKSISRDYDVLIENEGIALRGMFIIDKNGLLRVMSVNDLPIGRSVDETLRLLEAIQHVDQHGEVCPANWKKGAKSIKPDPRGAKEYFKNVYKPDGSGSAGSGGTSGGATPAGSGPGSSGPAGGPIGGPGPLGGGPSGPAGPGGAPGGHVPGTFP